MGIGMIPIPGRRDGPSSRGKAPSSNEWELKSAPSSFTFEWRGFCNRASFELVACHWTEAKGWLGRLPCVPPRTLIPTESPAALAEPAC